MLSQKMEKIFVCLPLLCGMKAACLTISGLHKIELLNIFRDPDIAYRSLDMIEEIQHQIRFGEILWESFQVPASGAEAGTGAGTGQGGGGGRGCLKLKNEFSPFPPTRSVRFSRAPLTNLLARPPAMRKRAQRAGYTLS